MTLIHELAHYWTESCSFEQLWMDEGYANFYAIKVLENLYSLQAEKELDRITELTDDQIVEGDLNNWSTPSELSTGYAYQTKLNYKKATYLTYSIYSNVGMEAFSDVNNEFSSMNSVTNSDYINVMESISGKEISEIYDEYL